MAAARSSSSNLRRCRSLRRLHFDAPQVAFRRQASQKRSNGRIEVDLAEVVGRAEDREPSAAPKAVVPAAEWQSIIDRIAEAEQSRANAQRDLAIAEHKLSQLERELADEQSRFRFRRVRKQRSRGSDEETT